MNKIIVTTVLLATLLLNTACTDYNNKSQDINIISESNNDNSLDINIKNNDSKMIAFPIEFTSKDRRETVVVEIEKESNLQDKLELITNTMSEEAFNGLPMEATIDGEEMAKIVLKEPTDTKNNRFSWEKDYLNEPNKERTINTLVKNILQEQYEGPWIKTVQLYYEEELITLD